MIEVSIDKRKEYLKKWRLDNKEYINANLRRWRYENNKNINIRRREYYKTYRLANRAVQNIKEKILRTNRYKISPWLKTLNNIKKRVKREGSYLKYGIKNYLNIEAIKILWFRDQAYNMDRPSIDRIDTTQHYTFDNCRFLELSENLKRKRRSKRWTP